MPDPVKIKVPGPGPYGFRLSGGDGQPLAVVKLRQKSKAYEGGLREGDVLLGVNGLSCETMSHAEAVALLESSNDHLELHIIRDAGGKEALTAAYQFLSSVLRRPEAREISISQQSIRSSETMHPSAQQPIGLSVTKMATGVTSVIAEQPQFVINVANREKERQEFLQNTRDPRFQIQHGQVPQSIKDEFKDKEEIIVYRHKPNMPGQTFRQEITLPIPTIAAPKVELPPDDEDENCTPTRGCTAVSLAVLSEDDNGIGGVDLRFTGGGAAIVPRLRPFESFTNDTITKSDLEAYIKFQISQFPGEPWLWHPSQVYKVNSKPSMEDFKLDSVTQEDINRIREELIARHSPYAKDGEGDNGKGRKGGGSSDDDIPLHLLKILTTIEDIDPMFWKRKKIYADSTFYDDEEHTYPTIQEQIKMARSVAFSLTSPENIKARGQRMFIKRKEKSQYWDIDNPSNHRKMAPSIGRDEPYYNPKPWKAPQRSNCNLAPVVWNKKLEEIKSIEVDITSPSSGKPEIIWGQKTKVKVPDVFREGDRPKILTAQSKLEIRAGKEKKLARLGGKVWICNTDELINTKGKAGKLFAQRRARSEERDEALPMFQTQGSSSPGGSHLTLARPLRAALNDIIRGELTNPPSNPGANSCRLKEMIAENNIKNNAWDYGSALKRTEHLFNNGHGVTVTTTVRETKVKKGDNGPRLKLKSSGGYRPVNFKAPLGLDFRPSSAPQDLTIGFINENECDHPTEVLGENGDGGITDF